MEKKALKEFQELEERRITGEIELRELEMKLKEKQEQIELEEKLSYQ
jgi:hypothetical protein